MPSDAVSAAATTAATLCIAVSTTAGTADGHAAGTTASGCCGATTARVSDADISAITATAAANTHGPTVSAAAATASAAANAAAASSDEGGRHRGRSAQHVRSEGRRTARRREENYRAVGDHPL